MMRKTSIILLGEAAGAAMTLLAVQPRVMLIGATAKAAAADTYRQLNLFGDVFERVRADYVVIVGVFGSPNETCRTILRTRYGLKLYLNKAILQAAVGLQQ